MNNSAKKFTVTRLSPVQYKITRTCDGIETITKTEVPRYNINGEVFEITSYFMQFLVELTDEYKEPELISTYSKAQIEKLQRAKIVSEKLYDFVEPHPDLANNLDLINEILYS
jgi:hypothetical protein